MGMTHIILEALKILISGEIDLAVNISLAFAQDSFLVQVRLYAIAIKLAPEVKGCGPLSCVNGTQ
jgi:hypothetical protein